MSVVVVVSHFCLSKTTGLISIKHCTKHPWVKGIDILYEWYFMAVNIIMYDSVYRGSWVSIVFSLPGLKVHVNFSDWNLFFVRRSRRFHRCYREPFIFLSYSPKPPRLFQSNLSQNILWWNELKLIPTNDYASFQGGIILA